ncbi:hypothetical protein FALCPG4_003499 [Fusarium falciforme]
MRLLGRPARDETSRLWLKGSRKRVCATPLVITTWWAGAAGTSRTDKLLGTELGRSADPIRFGSLSKSFQFHSPQRQLVTPWRVEDCKGLFSLPHLKDMGLSLENERNRAVSEASIPIRVQLRRHQSFVAKIPHSLNRRAPSQVATSRKLHDSSNVISSQSNGFSQVIQVLKTHKCAKERPRFKLLGGNRHQAHPRDDGP